MYTGFMKENHDKALEQLCDVLKDMRLEYNVPMCSLTSFRIGGPADLVLYPKSEADILLAMDACSRFDVPCSVIGSGTNLLVSDTGIRGLVICISGTLDQIEQQGTRLHVGAGRSLTSLAREALARGFMGLEWACGIPGSVGGACAMNAGAYGGEIKQILRSVRALHGGTIETFPVEEHDLGYRTSKFCAPEYIVLSAEFALLPDDGNGAERQRQYTEQRRQKQPLSTPSAGSTFKRPPGHFAGALIEQAGLKGFRIGGAMVSDLHAGFIVNTGGASADDVKRLIEHVQREVYKRSGVQLECEIKMMG